MVGQGEKVVIQRDGRKWSREGVDERKRWKERWMKKFEQ